MRNEKIKRITFTALMTAIAVVLSFVESLLPTAYFMPPGSKLGLSNIPVMFSASKLTVGETLLIVFAKSVFVFITRGFTAFCMSLAGGILSALCMIFIFRKTNGFGYMGIGILSALCHNAGQLIVSFFLVQTTAIVGYAPVLLIASVGTGFLTGTLLRLVMPYYTKLKEMEK
ncbi:MAG: Gx transporter family protein [Clostridia bacterium]|nr:Gx transporter family protein [Clostridia bacterium]MBQ4645228.1 Gx transporter family protein [Clostridia bacterium]